MRKLPLDFSQDSKSIDVITQPLPENKIKPSGKSWRKEVNMKEGDTKPSKRFGWNNGRKD
jgi:hypothetical protein